MTLEKSIRILDKPLEYSLYGLAFFIPIGIAFVEIFTITAISTFALKNILSRVLKSKQRTPAESAGASFFSTTNILLLLFFIFCALSLFNSDPYLTKALKALFGKWGKFILLFWAASASLRAGNRLKNVTLVLLASAGIVSLDALSQKFLGFEFLLQRQMVDVNYAGRTVFAITGAFKHPNDFASYLICAIPLLAGIAATLKPAPFAREPLRAPLNNPVILSPVEGEESQNGIPACRQAGFATKRLQDDDEKGRDQNDEKAPCLQLLLQTLYRSSLRVVILLLTFCLILTFSRAGWLCLAIAGVMMFFLLPRKKFFLLVGAIFIVLILSQPGASERAATSLQAGGDSGRYQLWKGTWTMISEHPFIGKGVGTFMTFFQDYVQGRGAMYAHNCYLQMWAEVGAFGLFSFLMFVGAVLRTGFKALRRSTGLESAGMLAGLLCGVVAFLVQSGLDTNLYSLQPSAMFWLFMAMIQATENKQREVISGKG